MLSSVCEPIQRKSPFESAAEFLLSYLRGLQLEDKVHDTTTVRMAHHNCVSSYRDTLTIKSDSLAGSTSGTTGTCCNGFPNTEINPVAAVIAKISKFAYRFIAVNCLRCRFQVSLPFVEFCVSLQKDRCLGRLLTSARLLAFLYQKNSVSRYI